MLMNGPCTNKQKFYWIEEQDLLDRVAKSVGDFASVFADMELDSLPSPEQDAVQEGLTALVGFEGNCKGVVWASCSESLAELIACRLRRVDLSHIEEGKRAAMIDMVTLLGGDIKLMFSPSRSDVRLTGVSVFKSAEVDCSEIINHPENLRCLFKHSNEHLHVGVMLGKDFPIPPETKK